MARFENLSSQSRVMPAVTVAASVLAFAVAAQFLMSVVYFIVALFQGQGFQPPTFGAFLGPMFLLPVFAFCVGVFAWLWLFAPLAQELRIGAVIAGSLLAVLAGAVLAFVMVFGLQMQDWLANANFFSNSLSQASESFARDGGNAFLLAVSSAVQLAVNALPVTVLAVVLTWIWVEKRSEHRVAASAQAEV